MVAAAKVEVEAKRDRPVRERPVRDNNLRKSEPVKKVPREASTRVRTRTKRVSES